jgi:hypothetical protein
MYQQSFLHHDATGMIWVGGFKWWRNCFERHRESPESCLGRVKTKEELSVSPDQCLAPSQTIGSERPRTEGGIHFLRSPTLGP